MEYLLGHSDREIQRLIRQADILRPITERLLREAGLLPGMRVLDLGYGAGDVSMLAGRVVGPAGSVIGIDRSSSVLDIAKARAHAADLRHVTFVETPVESFTDHEAFDLVVGRYVLVHQADPAAFIRAAASCVRRSGVLAFHEIVLNVEMESLPPVPVFQQVTSWIATAIRSSFPHHDVASRLFQHFADAKLPAPHLFGESLIGGESDPRITDWIVDFLDSVHPHLMKAGIATDDIVDIGTLKTCVRTAIQAAHSQVSGPTQVCSWVRL
jgi:ubiquinone/menaquinone biosynthesis C-methylase UbiE